MATKAQIPTNVTAENCAASAANNTVVSATLNLTAQDAAIITVQITNGATPPTTSTVVQVMHSCDGGTTWQLIDSGTAGLVASQIYSFRWSYGPEVGMIALWFGQNTGHGLKL